MGPLTLLQPSRVYFGIGCALAEAGALAAAGKRRLFVVTGPNVRRQSGPLFAAWEATGAAVHICSAVDREPEVALFEQVLQEARAFQPDAIIGLGGGSPLDVAKLVAALLDGKQTVRDIFGIGLLKSRAFFLACIPTTAGAGSEASPNAILLDERERLKKGVVSPHLVPDLVFLDPDLTLTVPPAVTAATGIDALVHCMEAVANRFAHPVVDVFALEGIRLISRSLLTAVKDGTNQPARADLLLGAHYGGICLGPVNTAAVHALAYPLGGEYRIAHGVANSLLAPPVFRFNVSAMPDRYATIARALGVQDLGTDLEIAEAGVRRFAALSLECGVPQRLRDLGIPAADLPRLAQEALKVQRLLKNNPRLVTAADAEQIYREAY